MNIAMVTGPEIVEAIPIIISLIIIEGLLSVDNALAIAALASHLPKNQQQLALRLGIIGAYGFRGLALFFVAWIIANPWLKIAGAAYLIYLMCSHLTGDEEDGGGGPHKRVPSLFATIISIEIMDLSLSIDNVVAAVAMSPKLWVVCTGVFIGILALRFLAGACIRLLEKYPVLAKTAFLLVGFVGFILLAELLLHVEIHSFQKFVGIALILIATLIYQSSPGLQKLIDPLLPVVMWPMRLFARLGDLVLWPFSTSWRAMSSLWRKDSPTVLEAVHIGAPTSAGAASESASISEPATKD